MNSAEQELKAIDEELESVQEVLDNRDKYDKELVLGADADKLYLTQRKSDILLGLEAGRKEVFYDIEKMDIGLSDLWQDEQYIKLKQRHLSQ